MGVDVRYWHPYPYLHHTKSLTYRTTANVIIDVFNKLICCERGLGITITQLNKANLSLV
jgi:hypothetical protein